MKILDLQIDGDTGVGAFSPGFGALSGTYYNRVLECHCISVGQAAMGDGEVAVAGCAIEVPLKARVQLSVIKGPHHQLAVIRE